MSEPTRISLNGVEWTAFISEVGATPRDLKTTRNNLKGQALVIPARTPASISSIQITFPYLNAKQVAALRALFDAGLPFTLEHTLEFPSGLVHATAFNRQRLKSLSQVVYTVTLTVVQDTVSVLPLPTDSHHPHSKVEQRFGF